MRRIAMWKIRHFSNQNGMPWIIKLMRIQVEAIPSI